MKLQADKHRQDRQFQIREQVLLKLQPYVQHSMVNHPFLKLAFKYFGPFPVVECIGAVAYKLQLPVNSSIHSIFHVSQLKPFTPNYSLAFNDLEVVGDLIMGTPEPVEVLDRRLVKNVSSAMQ